MKKILALVLAVAMCFGLIACGSGNQPAENVNAPVSENDAVQATEEVPEGTVEIVWWTSYGATNVACIQPMIDAFNESQDQYHVTIERQGSANELKAKLRSTFQENLPAMFSGTPETTKFYASSDFTACFQDFVDADPDKWTEDIVEVVRESYCDTEGKMWGAPFGASCDGIFVNVDLLEAAGYTVDDITSFVKVCKIAEDIVAGGHAPYGFAIHKNGSYLQNMLALEGVGVLDADDGYAGDPTVCLYDQGETMAALQEGLEAYAHMYKVGAAVPFGTDANGEIAPSFAAGNIGMFIITNSYTGKIINFDTDINFTYIPITRLTENGKYVGAIPGGTGNYICSGASEAEQKGAYEFIKFLSKVEYQVEWCKNTGYVPYTNAAAADEDFKAWSEEFFPAAYELLKAMQETDADVKLPYSDVDSDLLAANNVLMEMLYTYPDEDIVALIQEAALGVNEALEIAALSK